MALKNEREKEKKKNNENTPPVNKRLANKLMGPTNFSMCHYEGGSGSKQLYVSYCNLLVSN